MSYDGVDSPLSKRILQGPTKAAHKCGRIIDVGVDLALRPSDRAGRVTSPPVATH